MDDGNIGLTKIRKGGKEGGVERGVEKRCLGLGDTEIVMGKGNLKEGEAVE